MNTDLVKVWKLLQTSDSFITKARSLYLQNNSDDQYNTLIKCSLNCLLKIIKLFKQSLNAQIEATIYFQIADLLFKETLSFEMAREYCNKGIQICKRNEPQLISSKIQLQYLNFQIQFRNNSDIDKKATVSYLNEIIQELPDMKSFTMIKIYFHFIKFKYFGMNNTEQQKLYLLNKLISGMDSIITNENVRFYQILLMNLTQYQLINNTPVDEIQLTIEQLKNIQDTYSLETPLQFKAIKLLIEVMVVLQTNDYSQVKKTMKYLDSFLKSSGQKSWKDAPLPVKLHEGFSIQFQWISYQEFVIISFLLLAVSNMVKPWDDKATTPIFNKVETLINQAINSISLNKSLSLTESKMKRLKLQYLKYLTMFYTILHDLISDKYPIINEEAFEGYPELFSFIKSYREYKFTQEELLLYQELIPLITFIEALILHRNKKFKEAFSNYLKILLFFNNGQRLHIYNDPIKVTQLQESIGLLGDLNKPTGVKNQIYQASLINIIPLVEKKFQSLRLKQESIDEFDEGYSRVMKSFDLYLKLKAKLKNDLAELKNIVNTELGEDKHDWMVYLTISTIQNFSSDDQDDTDDDLELLESIINYSGVSNDLSTPILSSPNPSFISLSDGSINPLKKATSVLDIAPMLNSMIFYTLGTHYQRDKNRYLLQGNIDERIKIYSKSIKYSKAMISKRSTKLGNPLGQLSASKIKIIMERNPNLFDQKDIDKIDLQMKRFDTNK